MSGRFKPGKSGNPAGRPKGSGMAGKLRKVIEKEADQLVTALLEQAKAGDVQACRILLDRICPPLKAEAAAVDVPGLDSSSLMERAEAVLAATASGEIAPDVASQLLSAVATLAKVAEVDELERRLEALEQRQGAQP